MSHDTTTIVRYMVNDVAASVDFYTTHFGFEPIGLPLFFGSAVSLVYRLALFFGVNL